MSFIVEHSVLLTADGEPEANKVLVPDTNGSGTECNNVQQPSASAKKHAERTSIGFASCPLTTDDDTALPYTPKLWRTALLRLIFVDQLDMIPAFKVKACVGCKYERMKS